MILTEDGIQTVSNDKQSSKHAKSIFFKLSEKTISLNGVFPVQQDEPSFYLAAQTPAADDFIFCPVPQISTQWMTFSISFEDTGKYSFLETFKRLSEIVISVGVELYRKIRRKVRSLQRIQLPRTVFCSVALPLRLWFEGLFATCPVFLRFSKLIHSSYSFLFFIFLIFDFHRLEFH